VAKEGSGGAGAGRGAEPEGSTVGAEDTKGAAAGKGGAAIGKGGGGRIGGARLEREGCAGGGEGRA